jgi:hypothetical protein
LYCLIFPSLIFLLLFHKQLVKNQQFFKLLLPLKLTEKLLSVRTGLSTRSSTYIVLNLYPIFSKNFQTLNELFMFLLSPSPISFLCDIRRSMITLVMLMRLFLLTCRKSFSFFSWGPQFKTTKELMRGRVFLDIIFVSSNKLRTLMHKLPQKLKTLLRVLITRLGLLL